MKHSDPKVSLLKFLTMLLVVLLTAVHTGPMLEASQVSTLVSIRLDDVSGYSMTVTGSTKISPYLGRGLRYKSKGAPGWFEFGIESGDPFTKTFSGTMGTTYEVQAYVVENKASTVYSNILEVVLHDDPDFLLTNTPDHDLIDDDLLIGFTLDIEPNGSTIDSVSISINGPGLSSTSSGLSVPLTQKYTSIQGNSVYTIDIACITNTGTYTYQVIYNTTLTATPTPTPDPTPTPTLAPTPTPTAAPTETTEAAQTSSGPTEETTAKTEPVETDSSETATTEPGDAGNPQAGGGLFSSGNLTLLIVIGVVVLLLVAAIVALLIIRSKPKPPSHE